jgi:hypothetical protein
MVFSTHTSVVNQDFSGKIPHFSAKHKIFLLTVKDAERALFARIHTTQIDFKDCSQINGPKHSFRRGCYNGYNHEYNF